MLSGSSVANAVAAAASRRVADRRVWRGCFFLPGALPSIPWAPWGGIWTPAYGCYDASWRARMRDAYLGAGYTHWPYNCAGLPYGDRFPELADDPGRVARDLRELTEDGLVPVVCATDDRVPDRVLASFRANAAAISVCFPLWEMNAVLRNDLARMQRLILATRTAAPDADCYLHFTPGHGSISGDEAGGWRWCQAVGTRGLMAQGGNVISNSDPVREGKGFETTCVRLKGLVGYVVPDWDGKPVPATWVGIDQACVAFEWGIWEAFQGGIDAAFLCRYGTTFMQQCPHASGYCSGGDGGAGASAH